MHNCETHVMRSNRRIWPKLSIPNFFQKNFELLGAGGIRGEEVHFISVQTRHFEGSSTFRQLLFFAPYLRPGEAMTTIDTLYAFCCANV